MDPNILIFAIIGMLVLIVLTVLGILIYSGFFHNIVVGAGKPPVQDLYVAYKFRRGPYNQAGDMFTEICNLAPEQRTIGVYYDDPEQVPPEKLRFLVGCVMAEGSQRPDKSLAELLEKKRYKFTYFPVATNAVKTTFPFTTALSIYIAISRVYPKLGNYIREHKLCAHPIMEIYDGALIHFMAPLARQDEFYVPETDENYVEEPQKEVLDFIPMQPEAQVSGSSDLSQQISVSKQAAASSEVGQGDAPSEIPVPPKNAAQTGSSQENVEMMSGKTPKLPDESVKVEPASILTDSQTREIVTSKEAAETPVVTSTTDQQDDKSSSSSFEEIPMDLEEIK